MGVVGEAVVVTRGVVKVKHSLRCLVDSEPVAEIHHELWLVHFLIDAIALRIEILLPVAERQCRTIEAKLGRGCQ